MPLLIDNEIKEARLEIRHLRSRSLVTVIEVLSPANKIRAAAGAASFMRKREETLASEVHWVEIDLLRAGVPSVTRPPLVSSDYRNLVTRGGSSHGTLLAGECATTATGDRHPAAHPGSRHNLGPGRRAERDLRQRGLRLVHRLSQES